MKWWTVGSGAGGGGRRHGRSRRGDGNRVRCGRRLEGWGKTQIKRVINGGGNSKSGAGAFELGTETLAAIGDGRKNKMMEREGLAIAETKKSVCKFVTGKRT